MSEKSAGVKGKPPERQEDVSDENNGQRKEKINNTQIESGTQDKYYQYDKGGKYTDKRVDSRFMAKSNINKTSNNANTIRPRREDGRRSPRVSSGRGREVKSSVLFKSDYRRSSAVEGSRYFNEDLKLFRYLKRMYKDVDREKRLVNLKQLKEYIKCPDGAKEARKCADEMLNALQDVLYERIPKEVKQEAAHCTGIVGGILGSEAQSYFHWLFGHTSTENVVSDEIKCFFLEALVQTLKYDEKRQSVANIIPMAMIHLQSLLETADTPEFLTSVVEAILLISKQYPHVFTSHFRDTVDILVGWHIDSAQKDSLTSFTSQVLVELQPFWVSDIAFSVTLLGQFMEDMEAYAGDIDFNQDDKDAMEDCAGKLMALMKVFTTVVRSMGSSFGTVDHHLMPKDYILTLLMRILSAVEQVVKSFPSEKILTTANACVQSLVQQLGAEAQAKTGFLLQYILMQTEADKFLSYPYILSVLLLVQKTVESMDIKHLPVTFFTKLMAPSSLLRQARFANSTEVVQTTVNLLHSIMALKNVPLLEEVYRHIVGDLQVAYNTLLSCSGESKTLTLTEVNPMEGIEYTPQEAEAVFVFNLAVLGEIGTTKSNLMAMWALSPSLFDLFSVHFDPLEPSVSEMFPAVQYAVLKALYSHCARHGNFVSSSRLLTSSSYKEGSVLANVSHTNSANFSRILSLVTSVISSPSTSYEGRLLCLKWASDICASLQSNIALFGSEAFVSLLQVLVHWGHQEDMCITLSICHCLESVFLLSNNLSDVIVHGVLKLSMFKQTDNREKVREAYFSLLRLVPVDKAVRLNGLLHLCDDSNQTVSLLEGAEGVTSAWLAKRAHIASLPSNKFHNLNFRQVMAFILNNVKPVQSGSWHWLEVMFCDCQQQSTTKEHRNGLDSFLLTDFVKGNDGMLWFWATWEAAQFCVLNRLRTPLGKPQDTFTSIEGVLKTFAMSLVTSPEDAMVSRKGSSEGPEDLGCHLRVSLLLQFMEHLEKLLYNAYEGCAVAMPMSPKAVRTFFRTNKNTCLEWLSRIRTNIIRISLHCGCPATAVRHAYEQLQELRDGGHTQGPEFDQTILYLVQALTDLKQPDALMGVFTWCKEMLGKKLLWIKAAVEKASGRYEDAAKEFRLALNSLLTSEEDTRTDPETKSTDNMAAMKITGILSKHNPLQQTTQLNDQNLLIQKIHFTVNETMDSYMCLNDWDSMLEWQEELMEQRQQGSYSNLQSGLVPSVDINYVKALSSFDLGDHTKVRESFELVPGFSFSDLSKGLEIHNRIWGAKQKVESLHKTFIQTATMAMEDQEEEKTAVLDCLGLSEKMAQNLLRIQATEWPLLMSQQVLAELSTLVALKRHIQGSDSKKVKLPLSRDIKLDIEEHDLSHFLHLIRFLEVEQELTGSQDDPSHQLFELQIATASLSRKLGNFQKAETLLMGQIGSLGKETTDNGFIASEELLPSLMTLRSSHKVTSNLDILRLEREGAKLLHATGSTKEAIDLLSSSIVSFIAADQPKAQEERTQARCRELCSRSLLALVKWTQLDMKSLNSVTSKLFSGDPDKEALSSSLLAQNLQTLLEAEETGAKKKQGLVLDELDIDCALRIGDHPILSETDSMIGRMLHLGTMQAPSLSKAWFALGNWCYKWGRKAVDSASHGSVELLADEKAEVLSLLPKGTSSEETSKVIGVLSQIHSLASNEEDITENDEDNCDEGTETTRKQLLSCCLSLQIASEDCIDKLINVWRGIVYRVYHYYQLSAKGYFTYLRLNGTVQESEVNGDKNVIATLRLLRLLVKHAWELRNVLESGLAHTPTGPWKGIIPQLFSRLSHPELYVRQSISELLCRVAQDAPHLIVYPAVVGCSSAKTETKDPPRSGILNECLSPESEADGDSQHSQEAEEEDPSNTMLQNCLTAIVETLSANNPRMISEVKQLVLELRRITLLWDELWLGSLTQQHPEVSRKLQQLESEVKKVTSNSSLGKEEKMAIIREKHRTIMKPTVYAMERIQEITSQPAETPHEQAFQDMYGKLIDTAIEKLRNPTNPSNPSSSWQLFKQLHASLQKTAQKRSSLFLRMEKISPKIASLRNTVIAMPGLGASGKAVTIGSVSNTVQILPTKTKPKKLILLGSDGKKYPYLFKGLEDLHLDERIMQFLSIANNMLVSARSGDQHMYRARHYSVTPLGLRSGLIQWVEGATPLFGMYKKWQYREALAQLAKAQTGSVSTAPTSTQQPTPTIQRPSEIFYNKLTPALKDKGVTNFENRKEWPLTVLKTVLQELIDETPGDLLARELWCSSAGASEWWHVSQTYARSTAVMSMIGYIIGLGDRHLDNVLIDTATGEVVHIDYNVSFEKGKGLRVPEKVPFRMTQNIEKALGVTGIEGTFRIASEHVMKVMRKSRETLLTLLEAFVYDPLVDWTTGNEGGYTGAFYGGGALGGANDGRQTKQELEREITLSMFSIRMAEMKAQWQKNRDEMVAALPQLQQQVEGWMSIAQAYYSCHSNHQNMKDLQVMLREAIKDTTGSQLFSLKKRYEEYMQVKTSQDSVNLEITDKIEELTHWHSLHKYVIETINSQTFQLMCQDINSAPSVGAPSFASASDFLTGAGQGQVISQCEQLETEMTGCLQHIRANLHHAIEVLSAYANVVAQFGTGFADQNRTYHYLCWLQEVMNDFTTKRCAEVNIHFENLYGSSSIPKGKTQMVLITESKLQTSIKDWVAKRRRLVERRNQELVETQQLEKFIQDYDLAIKHFVQENGVSGCNSLMAWIISFLCTLNKRYNQMENAAAGAGDRLMDLTSRDGDWFLDELCSMSSNVVHFIDTLKVNTAVIQFEHFQSLYQALMSTHNIYIAMQDLHVNFRTIILPESLKAIQAQEPSVMLALDRMETMFAQAQLPMDKIVDNLETLHRNAIMGVENDSLEMMTQVKRIQIQYDDLLEGDAVDSKDLSPGQMLLIVFNNLFIHLEQEFDDLMNAMDSLKVPTVWRKVDAVREGKSMQLSSFVGSTRNYLSSLFFVKRLQAMQEFFHMCKQTAVNLQGMDGGNFYDDEILTKPIKRFIAEYVRNLVIGFPSQVLGYMLCVLIGSLGVDVTAEIELKDIGAESKVPLEDLRKKAVDICLRNGHFQHGQFTQASALTNSLDAAWRRHDLAKRLDINIDMIKGSLLRAQHQLTRLQWLHEDAFLQTGRQITQMEAPNRTAVMSEMKKIRQALIGQESGFVSCRTRYTQLEASIVQRLKWAAGANPSLTLTLQQFEDASALRKRIYEDTIKHSTEVVKLCQGILHLEALRTRTHEASVSDANFRALINRCEESTHLSESTNSSVTELEILLMNTKPPEKGATTDEGWVESCVQDISEQIVSTQQEVETLKRELEIASDGIKTEAGSVRNVLSVHHKLMTEFRTILKSMAKQEEQDLGDIAPAGSVRDYLNTYKNFSENFSTMLKIVMTEDVSKEGMAQASSLIDALNTQVSLIYDDLINLAPPLLTLEENAAAAAADFSIAAGRKGEMREVAPRKGGLGMNCSPHNSPHTPLSRISSTSVIKKQDKVTRDPRTGKAMQERNSYAVGVWRRVKMKLDGKDPDPNKRFTVAEQVDYVINEATHLDNLAVLYEGWTPWV